MEELYMRASSNAEAPQSSILLPSRLIISNQTPRISTFLLPLLLYYGYLLMFYQKKTSCFEILSMKSLRNRHPYLSILLLANKRDLILENVSLILLSKEISPSFFKLFPSKSILMYPWCSFSMSVKMGIALHFI